MTPAENEHEFDDLIKAAADKYNASGASPDWEQMKGLLDRDMPVKKDPRRRFFILFILLFLLSGGAYLYLTKSNDKAAAKTSEHASATDGRGTGIAFPPENNSENTSGIVAGGQKPDTQLSQNNRVTPAQKETKIFKPATRHTRAGNLKINIQKAGVGEENFPNIAKDDPSRIGHNKIAHTSDGLKNNLPPDEISKSNNKKADKAMATEPVNGENKTPGTKINSGDPTETVGPEKSKTGIGIGDSATRTSAQSENTGVVKNVLPEKTLAPGVKPGENNLSADSTITAGNKKNKVNKQPKHSFEFSLLYAPELTTIHFSHIEKPGSNYGLLIGYHITNAVTIQTGIIKSRKNYIADGEDFTTRRPLPANNKLYKVDGYCTMYEIPLNIKGQFLKRKNFNLFYTAGVSSYFMTNEFYNYYYSTPYGDSSRNAKFTSQNNYWLSLATVGVGLEKNITKALNIEVMPFLKIPFRGMGRGNLKLLSTGINFLLAYKPFLYKK